MLNETYLREHFMFGLILDVSFIFYHISLFLTSFTIERQGQLMCWMIPQLNMTQVRLVCYTRRVLMINVPKGFNLYASIIILN